MTLPGFRRSTILLLLLFCVYPAVWAGGKLPGEWTVWSHEALALAALALLALAPGRLRNFTDCRQESRVAHVFYGMIPAGLVLLMHYYFSRGNTGILCRGLWYFALPLFGAVFARELRRPLLWCVLLLGGADLVSLIIGFRCGAPPYGITGNWNWSATLLLAGCWAAAGLVRRTFCRGLLLCAGLLLPLGYLFFGTADYFPRGTVLAGLAALTLLAGGRIRNKRFRTAYGIGCILALLAAGIAVSEMDADGNRRFLAAGTAAMVKSHPLMGAGPGRFESEIPRYLPRAYYDGPYPAERHPHPHNELLNLAGEFGLAGVLLFGTYLLILCRSWRPAAEGRKQEGAKTALWLMIAALMIHGMADVVLASWPLDAVWLLGLGVLWGLEIPERQSAVPEMEQSSVYWPLRAVQITLVFFALLLAVRTGVSGYYARRAQLGGDPADWDRSRRWQLTPKNLYAGAADALFRQRDPRQALGYLEKLEPATLYRNFLHNQNLRARALVLSGKPEEALVFFELEAKNYPVSAGNLWMHMKTLETLGRTREAAAKAAELDNLLHERGRTRADLPRLLADPRLELKRGQ